MVLPNQFLSWFSSAAISNQLARHLTAGSNVAASCRHNALPFGHICFVVLVMRKGEESSWSGPWHLGCTLEVFHVYRHQDHFIHPCWAECFFCVFSLGLCFVCTFVLFWFFFCMSPFFCFPEQLSSPLQFLVLA